MAVVRMGVVGLGNMGRSHIRDHFPKVQGIELAAVCDADPARLEGYEVPATSDPAALIADPSVDAVLIATPHYDHVTVGRAALEAGKHVLVEKPIAVHVADAERLLSAARPGLVFAAMFNQRTDGTYRALRALIQSGELGPIQRINWIITNWFRPASYYASGGWRATWAGEGGGVLLNQCPHNLDLYQWLFSPPVRVRAFAGFGRFHNIEVEDEVTAYLEHADGATGVFIAGTGEFPGTNRLEIAADRGRVVVEHGRITFDRTPQSVAEFNATTPNMFGSMPTWKCEVPSLPGGGQHIGILQNFVDAIREGKELIAPAAEGIHSVAMANAMILSALEERTVELPLDGAHYERALRDLIANSRHQKNVTDSVAGDMSGSFR
jgi:predicted dehydrogenase